MAQGQEQVGAQDPLACSRSPVRYTVDEMARRKQSGCRSKAGIDWCGQVLRRLGLAPVDAMAQLSVPAGPRSASKRDFIVQQESEAEFLILLPILPPALRDSWIRSVNFWHVEDGEQVA